MRKPKKPKRATRRKAPEINLTGNVGFDAMRMSQEADFQQRMIDAQGRTKAREELITLLPSQNPNKARKSARTPRYKVARAFRPGHGRYS